MSQANVKHVGRYVEFPCESCATALTALSLPGPDSRLCQECSPVPPAVTSTRELPDPTASQIVWWLERARLYVDARQWELALVALSNAAAVVELDHPHEAQSLRERLAGSRGAP